MENTSRKRKIDEESEPRGSKKAKYEEASSTELDSIEQLEIKTESYPNLPSDVMIIIFEQLSKHDRNIAGTTCNAWRKIMLHPVFGWKTVFYRTLDCTCNKCTCKCTECVNNRRPEKYDCTKLFLFKYSEKDSALYYGIGETQPDGSSLCLAHVSTSTKYPLPTGKSNHLIRYQLDNQSYQPKIEIQVNIRELEKMLRRGERPDWLGIINLASQRCIPYHYTFAWSPGSQISFPDCPYLGGVPDLARWMKHVELTAYSPIEYIRLAKWALVNTELMFEWDLNQVCTPNEFSEYTRSFSHQGGIVHNSLTDKWHHIKALILANPCTNLEAVQDVAICKSKATLIIFKGRTIPSSLLQQQSPELKTIFITSIDQVNATSYEDVINADIVIVSEYFLKLTRYIAHQQSEAAAKHLIFADDTWKERPAPVLNFVHWHRLVSNVKTRDSFSSSYIWFFEQDEYYSVRQSTKEQVQWARLLGLTNTEEYPAKKECMDYIELQIKIDYMVQNLLWSQTGKPPFLMHRILDHKNEDIELTLSKPEEYLKEQLKLTVLSHSLSGGNFSSLSEFKTQIIKEQKLPSSHSLFNYKLEELQLIEKQVNTENIFPTEEQYPFEYALKQHGTKFAHLVKHLRQSFAEKDSCIIIASEHQLLLKKLANELFDKFNISYAYHKDVRVGDCPKVILFNYTQLDSFQPYTIDATTIMFAEPVDDHRGNPAVYKSHLFARVNPNPKVVNNLTVKQFYVKDSFEQYPWKSQRTEENTQWSHFKTPVLLKNGHMVLSNFMQIFLANNTTNIAKLQSQ